MRVPMGKHKREAVVQARLRAAQLSGGDTGDGGLAIVALDRGLLHWASPEIVAGIRLMLARLQAHEKGLLPTRLTLTSALDGEGVTFVGLSLASLLAHDSCYRTCFVDLNWWTPSKVNIEGQSGIADVIKGDATLDQVLIQTINPLLSVVPAGHVPPTERSLLAKRPELRDLLDDLGAQFDHLVLDLPAVLSTSDAIVLASLADRYALVVRHGVTTSEQVQAVLEELRHLSSLGLILNQVHSSIPRPLLRRIEPW